MLPVSKMVSRIALSYRGLSHKYIVMKPLLQPSSIKDSSELTDERLAIRSSSLFFSGMGALPNPTYLPP